MPESRSRDLTVDVARGAAIVLIVAGHVIVGMRTGPIIRAGGRLDGVMPPMYLVHIVVFAVLSGLFVQHGVRKHGRGGFLLRRALLFTWLYMLWTFIQRGMRVWSSATGNVGAEPVQLLKLWRPEGQLWFLPWLLAATTLVVLVEPWRSRTRAAVLLAATSILSLLAWGWEPNVLVVQGLALTPFLVVGAMLGPRRFVAQTSARPSWQLGLVLVLTATLFTLVVTATSFALPTASSEDRSPSAVVLGVAGTLSGTVALVALCALCARVPFVSRPAAFLGRRSMEIYLGHIVVTAMLRVALERAGHEDPWLHLVLGTVVGVVVPLALWWVTLTLRQDWLFGLPRWLERRLDCAAHPPR